jgi:hypothetical protein
LDRKDQQAQFKIERTRRVLQMERHTSERYEPYENETPGARSQLLDVLDAIKREHPELEGILQQFQIDQAEYDRTMLSILSSQIEPHNTYATSKGPFYA